MAEAVEGRERNAQGQKAPVGSDIDMAVAKIKALTTLLLVGGHVDRAAEGDEVGMAVLMIQEQAELITAALDASGPKAVS